MVTARVEQRRRELSGIGLGFLYRDDVTLALRQPIQKAFFLSSADAVDVP